jgi:ribose/xylose/arabinose/galactoside ABC-type transport system permease subunit
MDSVKTRARQAVTKEQSNQVLSIVRTIATQREFGIFIFLVVSSLAIYIYRPTFLSEFNVLNMGRQMAVTAVMGFGMTYLITAQELDLSVGSIFGVCSFGMALLVRDKGWELWPAFAVALSAGAGIGLVNGLITTYGRIPSFIATLGMLFILRGVTLKLSAWPVTRLPDSKILIQNTDIELPFGFFETFGSRQNLIPGSETGVPMQIIWMLLLVIIGTLVLNRTTYGYHVRATGSNRSAAVLSGIRVRRVKIIAFILMGVAAAFGGVLSFAHVTSVSPTAGTGMELTIIAAVIIGGTNLFGGEGTIVGTFLGAALLTVMRNGLVQIGGDGRLQDAFLGVIIIVAVLVHTHIGSRRRST